MSGLNKVMLSREELIEWFERDPHEFLDAFGILPENIIDLLEENNELAYEEDEEDEEEKDGDWVW